MKIDIHTLRYCAKRVERLGGTIELTADGIVIDLGQKQEILSWEVILNALENVIDQTINRMTSGVRKIKIKHATHIEGDEYICTKCSKRWSFDETDIPECTPDV